MSEQDPTPGADEATAPASQTVQPEASASATATVAHGGQLLRQAREAAGLHVAALAVSLKVPVRQIEALEQGQFDRLPGPIFVRALAGSVCRQLRVDAKPILAALPQAPATAPRVGEGLNEPFNRPGRASGQSLARVALRPPVLIAAGLLLAALLLFLLPPLFQGDATDSAVPAATAPGAETPTPSTGVPAEAPPSAAGTSTPILPPGQGGMSGVVVEPVQPLPLPGAPAATPPGRAP